MPKLDITPDEQGTLANAIEQALKSAIRAQNTGKTPQIREVYKQHENTIRTLQTKILTAK